MERGVTRLHKGLCNAAYNGVNMGESDSTRVPMGTDTRERLKQRKRGDDTYDDVIQRLLDDERAVPVSPAIDAEALADAVEGLEPADAEEIAREVVEKFDYAELASLLGGEVEERLR